jgi:hypothetical protein
MLTGGKARFVMGVVPAHPFSKATNTTMNRKALRRCFDYQPLELSFPFNHCTTNRSHSRGQLRVDQTFGIFIFHIGND